MATVKVTFTLDEATISRLRDAAGRLAKAKSQVIREAIHDSTRESVGSASGSASACCGPSMSWFHKSRRVLGFRWNARSGRSAGRAAPPLAGPAA